VERRHRRSANIGNSSLRWLDFNRIQQPKLTGNIYHHGQRVLSIGNTDTHSYCYTSCNPHSDSDSNCNTNTNAYAITYSDSNTYGNTDSNCYSNSNAYPDADCYSDP